MLPLLLTPGDCLPHLSWPAAIEALRRGHRLPRPQQGDVMVGTDAGRLLSRAAWIEGLGFAIKGDSIFPGNAARGLPSVQGGVMVYDPDSGALRAVIDSSVVTRYKTAADSVLGALSLARPDSRHLLIIGAGVVAATLARAYAAGFSGADHAGLGRISIWSRRLDQARALVATLGDLPCQVRAVTDLQAAAGQADIISAATMAREPVLLGEWVRPGSHIDLIGAYTPQMREADDALIAAALVYVDFTDTVVDRIGEIIMPIRSGAITRDHVRGDLYDLVGEAGPCRQSDDQITLFKNGGGAHLDLMIARYVLDAVTGG